MQRGLIFLFAFLGIATFSACQPARLATTTNALVQTKKSDAMPNPGPEMPVVMWGIYEPERIIRELPRMKDLGFNHCLVKGMDWKHIERTDGREGAAPTGRVAAVQQALDAAEAADFKLLMYISPGRHLRSREELRRVNHLGKVLEDVNGLLDEAQAFCQQGGQLMAETYGQHPALAGALIHTEVRDKSQLSFSKADHAAHKAACGVGIPARVRHQRGITTKPELQLGLPKSRVLPDNNPTLNFYRWFWKEGDGWNRLHQCVVEGIKGRTHEDFWTFYDPAVRVPSIWGNASSVNVLSHWSYTDRGPNRVGLATDQCLAMARGSGQPVMKMVQSFWYRSRSAPKTGTQKRKGDEVLIDKELKGNKARGLAAHAAAWEQEHPDADYVTISPDHMTLALWHMISRPITGVMVHGWGSLVESDRKGYSHTNKETQFAFKRFVEDVLQPLTPMLLAAKQEASSVAMLESFTSQMFAQRGSYGQGHKWESDVYTAIQHAGYQPRIVYEEEIIRDGLKGIRILFMPSCDVLPAGVVLAIKDFQKAGGFVVGDDRLCRFIKPDFRLESNVDVDTADKRKALPLDLAKKLRPVLQKVYIPPVLASNPEVITRLRVIDGQWLIFAINDQLVAGPYVGAHKLILEKGTEAKTKLFVKRFGRPFNAITGKPLPFARVKGGTTIDLVIPGGGGIAIAFKSAK